MIFPAKAAIWSRAAGDAVRTGFRGDFSGFEKSSAGAGRGGRRSAWTWARIAKYLTTPNSKVPKVDFRVPRYY